MYNIMLFAKMFLGIWCGIGLVFLLIGFFMYYAYKSKERKCTAVTVGKVIGYEVRHSHEDNTRSKHPVFEYYADGLNYTMESGVGTGVMKLAVGQSVTVHYNPQSPNQYFVEEYKLGKRLGFVFLLVGGVCIVIGIILFILFMLKS